MKLPKWEALITHFPNKPAKDVFTEIGGKVQLNYEIGVFTNACATRISQALNFSGEDHLIPYYTTTDKAGKKTTQVSSGEKSSVQQDGNRTKKWYIFRVRVLLQYLEGKYGAPETVSPAEYKENLKGRKGIIVFEVSGWSDATGHADLWDGEQCVRSDFGDKAHTILFWEAA
ncbi:MAG: type VI secretion system amidase effector protein Tae4 [Candidatus Electrothrix sp. YB6]